jgi:hypothetical protein
MANSLLVAFSPFDSFCHSTPCPLTGHFIRWSTVAQARLKPDQARLRDEKTSRPNAAGTPLRGDYGPGRNLSTEDCKSTRPFTDRVRVVSKRLEAASSAR